MVLQHATTTVAEYLFARLVQLGIDHVFGVPGDFSLALLDTLERDGSPSWVGTASELGAAYAADGYARVRGAGALATTFGVGELSAANGVAGAMAEDVAVLHIVGAPATAAMAAGAALHHTLGDGDHHRFARVATEITHTQVLMSRDDPSGDVDRALAALMTSRRPTYLLIPQDLVDLEVDAAPLATMLTPARPADAAVEQARLMIDRFFSEFPGPVALAGHLIARWHLRSALADMVHRCMTRTAALPNSKSVVDETSPGYLGVYSGKLSDPSTREAVESSAGRVLIGCSLVDTTTGGLSHRFEPQSTLVIGRDGVRWGDQSVEGVPFTALFRLLSDAWPTEGPRDTIEPFRPPLAARLPDGHASGETPLTQDGLWAVIAGELPHGVRLFADTGTAHYGALDIALPPGTEFEPATVWSSIGYSLPAAIGASIAEPERRCVVVVGDGAAQMVSQELGLIGRDGLAPVVILVNNDGYTVERIIRGPVASYNDIVAWRWQLVPRALGVDEQQMSTVVVRDEPGLVEALRAAFADEQRAHLVEVVTGVLDAPPTLTTIAGILRAKSAREEKGTTSAS